MRFFLIFSCLIAFSFPAQAETAVQNAEGLVLKAQSKQAHRFETIDTALPDRYVYFNNLEPAAGGTWKPFMVRPREYGTETVDLTGRLLYLGATFRFDEKLN